MPSQKNSEDDRGLWEELPLQEVQQVLADYSRRHQFFVRRTISFKFHKPSWRKVQNLLWAHKHFHNYIYVMLETVREDPMQFRDDGAFECIREMMIRREATRKQGKRPGNRVRVLSDVIAERFRKPRKPKDNHHALHNETNAAGKEYISVDSDDDVEDDTRYQSHRRPPLHLLEPHDYPIIYTLRPGAERRCALMLLNFYIQSQKVPKKKKQPSDNQPEDVGENAAFERVLDDTANEYGTVDDDDNDLTEHDITEIEEMLDAEMDTLEAEGIPTIAAMHQTWARRWIRYRESAKTRIPRGRHRGRPFGEALATRRMRTGKQRGKLVRKPGKRRVRWLKEHTHPLNKVISCLKAVQVLLHCGPYDDESEEVLQAEQVRHLWKYELATYRSPRARQDAQYRVSQSRQLATLGSLSDAERYNFRDELYEMLDHARQYEQIAEAVEIFLDGAPPSYPTLEPALFAESNDRAEHRSALNWFSRPVTSAAAKDDDKEDDPLAAKNSVAELLHRAEYDAVTRLLQAESELGNRALQPLVYTRTMRPPNPLPCWALLYKRHQPSQEELEKRYRKLPRPARKQKIAQVRQKNEGYIYTFVLAMVIHHTTYAFTGDHSADYFAPDIRAGEYFYVNFPLTPFVPPDGVSLMTFPLECGEAHQETLLHELITRLRADQQARYEYQFTDEEQKPATCKPVEECLPRQSALGEAKIITRLNGDDWYEFFLHCAVPVATSSHKTSLERILGLHQHKHGYSWALIDQKGTLINTGDLPIPWHVRPHPSRSTYSDNYAFEVANQIVQLAAQHHALIAIQNTWTSKKAGASASRNRRTFAHPSRKIYTQVVNRALEAGLPRPRHVFGVSRQCCGNCGQKRNNMIGIKTLEACPACGSLSRLAHLQFPLASLTPTTEGKPVPRVLLAKEQENGVRAAAMTDFFFWTVRVGTAENVSSDETRQACIAGLEQVQWRGRQVFHARTGRNHHTSRTRQRETNGLAQPAPNDSEEASAKQNERPAFRPRQLAVDVIIAGPHEWEDAFRQWIADYRQVAPDVLINYFSMSHETALNTFYQTLEYAQNALEVDVVILNTPASKHELEAGLATQESWFCQDCGQHWQVSESWFRCTHRPCSHDVLARYNTAMVVSQLALRDLVRRAREQQNMQGIPTEPEDG